MNTNTIPSLKTCWNRMQCRATSRSVRSAGTARHGHVSNKNTTSSYCRLFKGDITSRSGKQSGVLSCRRITHQRAVCCAAGDIATATSSVDKNVAVEFDEGKGMHRLVWTNSRYNVWTWRDRYRINWVSGAGLQTDSDDNDERSDSITHRNNIQEGPIVLLVHGFGASVYHWRYVIPQLAAKGCRVYALDCLGFGMSDKALVDYEGYDVWKHQISDFIREVIHAECGTEEKVCLVGNSLGGYNSLATAASFPHLVDSVVLLNGAGRFDFSDSRGSTAEGIDFRDSSANNSFVPEELPEASASDMLSSMPVFEAIGSIFKRFLVGATFIYTKQPARVKQVLRQVYWNDDQIDDDLVESILAPAQDPKAASVFYRVITSRGRPLNRLLDSMERHQIPLFLLWGSKDPWCVPANADRIQQYYSKFTTRVDLESSGHCPHDDTPMEVVNEILRHVNILD